MTFLTRDIVKACDGRLVSGFPSTSGERICTDTRNLRAGDVFFALRGPHFDAHDFLPTAAARGAKMVVVDRLDERLRFGPTGRPDVILVPDTLKALQHTARFIRSQSSAMVIGVTGSNGKTTTKEMIASILRRSGKTLSTRGNLNNHIGLPLTICELEEDHRFAVIEMGTSQPGDMEVLIDVSRPQVGLITNVGKDHLEFFDSPEGVLNVNRQLFDALPSTGTAIINLDDPLLAGLSGRLKCRVVTYGKDPKAHIRIEGVESTATSVTFTLFLESKSFVVTLPTSGAVQATNAMSAAAVAWSLNMSPEDIVAGLAAFKPAPMRLEACPGPNGVTLINDAYNANPSSVRASVESFCQSYKGRSRWVVLGDMRELGTHAKSEHEQLGQWLATMPIDRIFLYGRDTRFTLSGYLSEGKAESIERYRKKRYLIDALLKSFEKNAPAVLFKASRSMRLEDVVSALLKV